MSEGVMWFERGRIGEEVLDLLTMCDTPNAIRGMEKLGLSDEEIIEALMRFDSVE